MIIHGLACDDVIMQVCHDFQIEQGRKVVEGIEIVKMICQWSRQMRWQRHCEGGLGQLIESCRSHVGCSNVLLIVRVTVLLGLGSRVVLSLLPCKTKNSSWHE